MGGDRLRRLSALVAALVLVPSLTVNAVTFEELLERGREAAYTAEQVISCATPDGFRGVLTRIRQSGSLFSISSPIDASSELSIGAGGWALHRDGGVVEEATLVGPGRVVESDYLVEEMGVQWFMGRDASGFRLVRDGLTRAEVVLDDETGAIVRMVTFDDQGEQYCQRRFVTFDDVDPELPDPEPQVEQGMTLVEDEETELPTEIAGFTLLDRYVDLGGIHLAYYSDGLFSFALFEAPTRVELPEGIGLFLDGYKYSRSFGAGQVTYVWEVKGRGMALVGDLPPDLHSEVLASLPRPADLGFLHRFWRNLFGPR